MKEFKNIFSTPLFVIIFRPEILLFVTHSFLTGLSKVEFVIYWVLSKHGHYGNMGCQIPKGGKNLYAYIFGHIINIRQEKFVNSVERSKIGHHFRKTEL